MHRICLSDDILASLDRLPSLWLVICSSIAAPLTVYNETNYYRTVGFKFIREFINKDVGLEIHPHRRFFVTFSDDPYQVFSYPSHRYHGYPALLLVSTQYPLLLAGLYVTVLYTSRVTTRIKIRKFAEVSRTF
jgi:hypothetical protein